jgi:hypothetical protein
MRIEVYGTYINPGELQQIFKLDKSPQKKQPEVLVDAETWQLVAAGIVFLGSGIVGPLLNHELAKRRERGKKPPASINVVVNGKFLSKEVSQTTAENTNTSGLDAQIKENLSNEGEDLVSVEFED